ncbi:MAG: pyridoxamine 5'-phosphate oxidase family protein [Gammaproteobacteria bacterium]|nr:pyridoxamine 5'-phosphate oxidase family protein [Gammaproteobacteria bacterium]
MTTLIPSQFIKAQQYGVLSTHSLSESGYPFGSITPYIISSEGDIAILISHLAEHTHNIEANPKVSLTIFDPKDAENPSAGARVTCLANVEKAASETELRKDYLHQFPESEITLGLPGFHFYLLKLTKVRLVAGFGQVKWLDVKQLSL